MNAQHFHTSARLNKGIEEMFLDLAQRMMVKADAKPKPSRPQDGGIGGHPHIGRGGNGGRRGNNLTIIDDNQAAVNSRQKSGCCGGGSGNGNDDLLDGTVEH